ncbi:MAG: ChaN family lipoprotein [Deltaproteobacteria bacterium]|nr:ChaN family lipoprotein [Deltaproteobacteria bacterium]
MRQGSGTVAAALVVLVGGGCVTVQEREHGPAPYRRPAPKVDAASIVVDTPGFEGEAPYAYFDGATGAAISFDDVVARARAAQVIVLGEQHDQATHHELQRRVVAALAAPNVRLTVGFEMLSWSYQGALDRLADGKLDADAFAAEIDWKKAWGFPFELYRPIFQAAVDGGARMRALNAPRELVRAVRKKGIDKLSADELRQLPDLDLGDPLHREWFRGVFASGGHPATASDVDAFYTAQVVWDESMADGAARALADGAEQVIVIAGAGHVARGRGIPQRVERRRPGVRVVSVVPLTGVDGENAHDRIRQAVLRREADILVVPRFEREIDL